MWGSGNAPRGADRAIKHPGRNLQPPIGGVARETAAENLPVSLLDHLMNVNTTPGPGMPRIKKLAFLGPVGVLSSVVQHREAPFLARLPDPAAYAEDITATGSDAVLMEGSAPPPCSTRAKRRNKNGQGSNRHG